MCPCMIADIISAAQLLLDQVGISLDESADIKKGGMDVIPLENRQDRRRVCRAWTIVKGQRDLREIGISVVEKAVVRYTRGKLGRQSRGKRSHWLSLGSASRRGCRHSRGRALLCRGW